MTNPNIDTVLHYLALAAPIAFGALIVSIIVLNLLAFILYRHQGVLHERLQRGLANLRDEETGIRSTLAEARVFVGNVEKDIAELDSISADQMSPEEKGQIEAGRARLIELRTRAHSALATAEKNVARYEMHVPDFEKHDEEYRKLKEAVETSDARVFLLLRLVTRWLEYFGNRAPATALGELSKEERSK
jgi:hypothetical protein